MFNRNTKAMELDDITRRLDRIERYALLGAKKVLDINEAALLTGLSKSYIYRLTSAKRIPHYKPSGRVLYFDKAEIEEWMKQNRVCTALEAEQSAHAYIAGGRGR
ncbi:MAG: helix-turn-helix domain-containing protein [Clostridium sp.]|nr:helix-turn-helix domain-containing protein [Bacteroidales bacterium]MCM1510843.1 helix-turn-helix domain-containing protein [Clostridium sp.]